MDSDLPPSVKQSLDVLRARGSGGARLADRLLERRRAALGEEQERLDKAILSLAKPSRGGLFFKLLFGGLFLALGAYFYLGHQYEEAARSGRKEVAEVTRMEEGFCLFGTKRSECLSFQVRVLPKNSAPFPAEFTYDLPNRFLGRVEPGSLIIVSVDQKDPNTVRLFEEALASAPPPLPAGHKPRGSAEVVPQK